MSLKFKTDIFEPDLKFTLHEAASEDKGKSILGRVRGTFFVPNGISRNKRFYTEKLWKKALARPEIQEKLENKRMLGTIGHEQTINDAAILEGKISHIVTALSINEKNQGEGEAIILDTPAGRALYTLLEAGSKLYVSSRALGEYRGKDQATGLPKVDEDSYELQTFDFVIDPGFLEANPALKESLSEVFDEKESSGDNNINQTGVNKMEDKGLANHIIEESQKVKKDLSTALEENTTMRNDLAVANNEVRNLKEEVEELNGVKEELDTFKTLGSVEEIKEALEAKTKLEEELKTYKSIDEEVESAAQIKSVLEKAHNLIKEYALIGTPNAITACLEKLNSFKEAVEEFGTVEEVEKLYNFAEGILAKEKEERKTKAIAALAEEIKVPVNRVEKLYDKLTEDEIREAFNVEEEVDGSKEKEIVETYSSKEVKLDKEGKEIVEVESESKIVQYGNRSLTSRLMEGLTVKSTKK